MGWYYGYGSTRVGTIAECTQGFSKIFENGKQIRVECIAKCFRGAVTHEGVLWSVWEQTITENGSFGLSTKVTRFIRCDLMHYQRGHGINGWGYKPLEESMHPYYYNCPEKYLKMVPEITSQEWRNGVIKWHTTRRVKLAKKKIGK